MAEPGWGEMIRKAREGKGLTQVELGQQLSTSNGTISRWENEHTEPSFRQVNDLIIALSLPADLFYRRIGASLTPPAAARLPRALVLELLTLTDDEIQGLLRLLLRRGGGGGSQGKEQAP